MCMIDCRTHFRCVGFAAGSRMRTIEPAATILRVSAPAHFIVLPENLEPLYPMAARTSYSTSHRSGDARQRQTTLPFNHASLSIRVQPKQALDSVLSED